MAKYRAVIEDLGGNKRLKNDPFRFYYQVQRYRWFLWETVARGHGATNSLAWDRALEDIVEHKNRKPNSKRVIYYDGKYEP